MSSWSWSLRPKATEWKESVAITLAVIVLFEGRIFYSDLVRGIAVGMFVMLFWLMLAERRAALALLCGGLVWQAFGMTPYRPEKWMAPVGYFFMHLPAVMFVVILAWGELYRYRLARSGAQVPQG